MCRVWSDLTKPSAVPGDGTADSRWQLVVHAPPNSEVGRDNRQTVHSLS